MKKRYFLLALLLISENAWAQLTCTNCQVNGHDYVAPVKCTLLAAGASTPWTGNIVLIGDAVFNMGSPGIYTLACAISERGTGGHSLMITANNLEGNNIAGVNTYGREAALVFSGNQNNTYTGPTKLTSSGSLVLNKTAGRIAIPKNLVLNKASSNVWCLADNQFGLTSVIDMRSSEHYARFHLYGTTQTVEGIEATNAGAVIQNFDMACAPSIITDIRTSVPTINIFAKEQNSSFGPNAHLRSVACTISRTDIPSVPKLVVNKTGSMTQTFEALSTEGEQGGRRYGFSINCLDGKLIYKNPNEKSQDITFRSLHSSGSNTFPTIEFNAGIGEYFFGTGCTFATSDIHDQSDTNHVFYKKTGPGTLGGFNSTFSWKGVNMNVEEGIFRNEAEYNNWINSTVFMNVGTNAVFDLWGNHTNISGLNGQGIVQNNWGAPKHSRQHYNEHGLIFPRSLYLYSAQPGYRYLTIGNTGAFRVSNFYGIIRDNSSNGAVSALGLRTGGVALRKVGAGEQTLYGNNTYTGPTRIENGKLKLAGNGLLGGGNYGDSLLLVGYATSISFEHKGDLIQRFSGDISGVSGYIQSGKGKTIITGTGIKTFTGTVEVTGGFFGGTGDISNVSGIEVQSGGIGGGEGAKDKGGVLKVANLSFYNYAKVVVTNRSSTDNNPSVIDVKIKGGASGSGGLFFSNAEYLIVDLVGGTGMLGGTILKATISDAALAQCPILAVGANNTGKTPCFRWTTTGLEMTLRTDNNTPLLSAYNGKDLTKLCSGGLYEDYLSLSNGGSSERRYVFFNAETSTPGIVGTLLEPVASHTNRFSIRAGSTLVETNQEVEFLVQGDGKWCTSNKVLLTINPNPTITPERTSICTVERGVSNTTKLTANRDPAASLAWSIPSASQQGDASITDIDLTNKEANLVAHPSVTEVKTVTVLYTDNLGCWGETAITINPNPTITPDRTSICTVDRGVSNTTGLTANHNPATSLVWSVIPVGSASIIDSVLTDRLASLVASATVTEARTVTVFYTDNTGCQGATAIAINPNPTIIPNRTSICTVDRGVSNTTRLIANREPATSLAWLITPTTQDISITNIDTTGKEATLTANAALTVSRAVTVLYTDDVGCQGEIAITINPNPTINSERTSICTVNHGVSNTTRLTAIHNPATSSSWLIPSNSQDASITNIDTTGKEATLVANAALTVSRAVTVFYTNDVGCQGEITITINPNPTITSDRTSICAAGGVSNTTGLTASRNPAVSSAWLVSPVGSASIIDRESTDRLASLVASSSVTEARTVTVSYTDHTGCIGETILTINPNPTITPDRTSICAAGNLGNTTRLTANHNPAASLAWAVTPVGSALITDVSTTGKAVTFSAGSIVTEPRRVSALYTDNAGCQGTISIMINPNPTITPGRTSICTVNRGISNTTSLTANRNPATTLAWTVNPVGSASITDIEPGDRLASLVASSTVTESRIVSVLYTDHTGCQGSTTVTINPNPTITSGRTSICTANHGVSNTTNLTANHAPATSLAWSVPAGGASIEPSGQLANLIASSTVTESRIVSVFYTDNVGCQGATIITVNPNPTITSGSTAICASATTTLEANRSPATFSAWTITPADTDASIEDIIRTDRMATFHALNTTLEAPRMVTVLYTDHTGCIGSTTITVNPNPVISATIDVSKLCSGLEYADALVSGGGSWAIYKTATEEAGISSVINTAGHTSIQAANVTGKTLEDVVLTSHTTSCKSQITITIYPKPVMNTIPGLVTCGNMEISAYLPSSSGVDEARPTHYQWSVAANAVNSADVGLSDHMADWTQPAISEFTARDAATILRRDVTVFAYNATSGCRAAEPQVFTITVNPGLTVNVTSSSPICSGSKTDVLLRSTLPQTTYTWTVSSHSAGAQSQTTASGVPFIQQTLTNRGSASETVTYEVTGVSGHCSGTVSVPIEVSHIELALPTVEGGGHYCADPEDGTYQTHLIPSVPGRSNVEWTYISYSGSGQAAGSIAGNTQRAVRGALTELNNNLVLSGTSSALVYYVFRPYSAGCFGIPSDPIGINLYAAPVASAIPLREMCSSSEAYPTAANIALSSSTPDVVYTWTVNTTNGPGIRGYSEPSREGAIVPTHNPAEAKSGTVSDALLLLPNAEAQTIDYWITPWHLGCPGKAVLGRVKVNPIPVVSALADREHCLGTDGLGVAAETLSGTHGANAFAWTGGQEAGLLDQSEYGAGLPAYTVPQRSAPIARRVVVSGKNDKGCKGATAFNITVNPTPSATLGGAQTLCAGPTIATAAQTNIEVSSIAGTKYKWTASVVDFRPDGKSVVKIVDGDVALAFPIQESLKEEGNLMERIIATTDSDAHITFSLTPSLGNCLGTVVRTNVRVKGIDLLSGISNNSPDICSGGTTSIKVGNGGDGNTYNWVEINNFNNVLGFSPSKLPSSATVIHDILTVENNRRGNVTYRISTMRGDCMGASVSHTVFVNPIPVLSLSSASGSICSGVQTDIDFSINLKLPESNEVYYSWKVHPNTVGAQSSSGLQAGMPRQELTNNNALEDSVTYTIIPWYRYNPNSGGNCKGQPVTFTYRVNSRVVSISSVPEAVCLDDKIILKANISKGVNCQWLKDREAISGARGDSYAVPTDKESVSSYAVSITNSCGSSISDARIVRVSAEAYFTSGSVSMDKGVVLMDESVRFSYSGTKADYVWDFNDSMLAPNTESVIHRYIKSGIYYPTLKATKPGQAACTKTFSLSPLEVRGVDPTIGYEVFPIPARDRLTVNSSNDLQNITLCDVSGKTVVDEAVKGRSVTLSVEHIIPGVYLLIMTDFEGMKRVKKIFKE